MQQLCLFLQHIFINFFYHNSQSWVRLYRNTVRQMDAEDESYGSDEGGVSNRIRKRSIKKRPQWAKATAACFSFQLTRPISRVTPLQRLAPLLPFSVQRREEKSKTDCRFPGGGWWWAISSRSAGEHFHQNSAGNPRLIRNVVKTSERVAIADR